MSYDTERKRVGREPITVLELDLDFCTLTYGVAPCTAAVGVTGSQKCFNTRKTCQDAANYSRGTKTYRFCTQNARLPVGEPMFPAIIGKPSIAPTKITPGKGLGFRGSVTVTLQDFPHHDRGIDPYVSGRSYDPEQKGTFFGKLLARNPYWQGRIMRVRTGYLTDPFDWSNFQTRTYVIDKIEGPDSKGRVKIVGKDLLKLADGDRSQAPKPSKGKLLSAIDENDTTLTLTPSGIGDAEYAASGTYRIGDEVGTFTRSGDTVTLTARGLYGTQADSHDADDTFQQCLVYEDQNVVDIINDLLTTYAGINASYIPYDNGATGTDDEWDLEKRRFLAFFDFTARITKPTAVKDLIEELCVQSLTDIWWDEIDSEVKLKANAPPFLNASIPELTDDYHLLADTIRVREKPEERVSQVWVFYDPIDITEDLDKEDNYKQIYVDATKINTEDPDLYGSSRPKKIFSRWIVSEAQAAALAGRMLARFSETPRTISFTLDAKDSSIWTGDPVDVTTWQIQDETGAKSTQRVQILETVEDEPGHHYDYEALTYGFTGRYGYIAPDGTPDYSSATNEQKNVYAFIAPDSGEFSDGTEAYKII